MKDEELDKLKNEAVNASVRWGKTGLGLYSMRDAVNAYMKASGADNIPFDGINGIREKRKIVSDALIIHCIAPLSKEQLYKVEMELNQISNSIPTYIKPRFKW